MLYKILLVLLLICLLVGGGFYLNQKNASNQAPVPTTYTSTSITKEASPAGKIKPFDFANKELQIDEMKFKMVDGEYQDDAHSFKILDQVFSPSGTLASMILVDNAKGSGVFYYVVGATMKAGLETYSKAEFLGDRIQYQKTVIEDAEAHDNGEIVVTYLDRGPNDPMSSAPTKQMEKKFSFSDSGNLVEVLD